MPSRIRPRFLSEASLDQILYTGKAVRIIDTLLAEEAFDVQKPIGYASTVFSRIFESTTSSSMAFVPDPTSVSFTQKDFDLDFPRSISILDRQCPILSAINPTHHAHSMNGGDPIGDYSLEEVDFQWRMEGVLATSIEEQYKTANSLLKSILFTRSRLQWHLKGMAEFYFMMQGEIMHSYSTDIFTKVCTLSFFFIR